VPKVYLARVKGRFPGNLDKFRRISVEEATNIQGDGLEDDDADDEGGEGGRGGGGKKRPNSAGQGKGKGSQKKSRKESWEKSSEKDDNQGNKYDIILLQ
jgi:hypothetical protein